VTNMLLLLLDIYLRSLDTNRVSVVDHDKRWVCAVVCIQVLQVAVCWRGTGSVTCIKRGYAAYKLSAVGFLQVSG
jgi:hypothetical protein